MCTNCVLILLKEFNRQWRIAAFKSSPNPQNNDIFQGLKNVLPSTSDISMYEGFLSLISRKNVPRRVKHEQKEMVSRACEVKIVEIYVYKTGTKISRPLVELQWKYHGRPAGINVREWRLSTAKTWPLVDMALAMVSGRQHPVFFLSRPTHQPNGQFFNVFPSQCTISTVGRMVSGRKVTAQGDLTIHPIRLTHTHACPDKRMYIWARPCPRKEKKNVLAGRVTTER